MAKRLGVREVITVVGVVIAVSIVGTRLLGRQYPILPFGVAAGVLVFIHLTVRDSIQPLYTLIGVTALSTFYRAYVFLYPASFIGADADSYVFHIQRLMLSGDISAIGFNFYSSAPNYLIFGASSSLVTDLPLRYALVVIPLLLGIVIPIVAYIVARHIGLSQQMGVVAAGFTAVTPITLLFSKNPVAQSLSVPIALTILLAILVSSKHLDRRVVLIGVVLFMTLIYTHKLAPLILVVSLVLAGIVDFVKQFDLGAGRTWIAGWSRPKLVLIFGVMYYLQWVISNIDYITIYTATDIIIGSESVVATPPVTPTAASPIIDSSWMVILLNVGHYVPTLFLAGLGWLIVFFQFDDQSAVSVVLSVVAIMVVFTVGAFFDILSPTPARFFFLVTPLVAALATAAVSAIPEYSLNSQRVTIMIILILSALVIIPQAASVVGPADSQYTQRAYLTSGELEAKSWADQYVEGPVATDGFYAGEMPPSQIASYASANSTPPTKYQQATTDLLNASLDSGPTCWFAVRQGVTRYSLQGRWKLTYDPATLLTTKNRIYDSGLMGTGIGRGSVC